MDNRIQICQMTLQDLETISSTLTTDFDDFWNVSILHSELTSPISHFLVAKKNNEIIGFGGIKLLVEEADLMNIVTKKSFRHQGVATLLLENLIHLASTFSLHRLTLEVNENNLPAISLYQKFGFTVCGIRKNYYFNSENAILMEYTFNKN